MRILLATDGSDAAGLACAQLLRLPLPKRCEATVLHVVPLHELDNLETVGEGADAEEAAALRGELQQLGSAVTDREAAALREHGWQAGSLVRGGDPAAQIIAAAEEIGADLVAIGATGEREATHVLLGSVAKKVLDHAPCSVLVARGEPSSQAEDARLLIGYDSSPAVHYALQMISEWPLTKRVEITVVAVMTVATNLFRLDLRERLTHSWRAHRWALERELAEVVEQLESAGASVESRLLDGGPRASDELLEATRLLASDLAVVGHVSGTGLKKLLLGSVAWDLAHYAPCSVLVARK